MFKRQISCLLALVMILQILTPFNAFAREPKPSHTNFAKVGEVSTKGYPQIGTKLILQRNKEVARSRKVAPAPRGVSLRKSDYVEGGDPSDSNKPNYFGRVSANLITKGLDNGPFQWGEIFGKDALGNNHPIRIEFHQLLDDTPTGIQFSLEINKNGTYKWQDGNGNPTLLPLYSVDFKPFKYSVFIDKGIAEKVKLITSLSAPTPGTTFKAENGKYVADIEFKIDLQQVAASNFSSIWKTDVAEGDRPQIEGNYVITEDGDEINTPFNFPKNETSRTVIRDGFVENFVPDEANDILALMVDELANTPTKVEVKTDTQGLIFDTTKNTVKSGDHKYKYDFTYDVIKGGKLTMTEVLPVTFDANGGKFASITDENAEQKIVKEVEYNGTLTDKAEEPKKALETFKGWGIKDNQGKISPVTDEAFKNIKEAKTFYAIWDNNEITAEELEVKESFKDGAGYVNDFIPTLDQLKGQVKIKDTNNSLKNLTNEKFEILKDDGTTPFTDQEVKDGILKTCLYNKLLEKSNQNDEPTRIETVKAKVTHANGTSQTVDIPIKVIKNIYEAKTLTDRPYYVPTDYVKVIVDPTTKAQDPQKTYYYVNPAAKVVIPGEDPMGTDGNTFVKWTYKDNGTETEYKLADKPRHQFEKATTITAQYVSDVIPQEGTEKPDTVPKNYVEVKFVPTDKATDETKAEKIFWVNPDKAVTIPVTNPKGATYYTFKEWKMGVNADGAVYKPTVAQKFTAATTITATYDKAEDIIPYDPTNFNDPKIVRPDGYVRITFEAEEGLTLSNVKAYYVKKDANITLGNAKLAKPTTTAKTGYEFKEWDKKDDLVLGTEDVVVKALAKPLPDTKEKKNGEQAPTGYIEVKFVAGDNGKLTESNADIAEKVYYVNPNKYVTLTPPTAVGNTGYEFGSWDKDAKIPTQYKDPVTTITANFNQLKAVIPKTKNNESEKPAGYKTVTFVVPNENEGYIHPSQTKVYYVDPKREVTLQPPIAKGKTGYQFKEWDQDTTKPAKKYTEDTTVKASFTKLQDIIGDGKSVAKPDGYVTVIFDKGAHGSLTGVKTYYVNPVAKKTMGELKKKAPKVTPDTGYEFTSWSRKDNEVITEDSDVYIITAQYEALDDVIPQKKTDGTDKPNGYITVTFEKGAHGSLEGTTVYYVNPNKAVVLKDKAPTIKPDTGYKSAGWDTTIEKAIQYKDGDKITALYNEPGNISTTEVAGYVKVIFNEGASGSLTGTTAYWIKPGVEVNIPAPTVKPNVGYKFDKWDNPLTVTKQLSDSPYTITASYGEEQAVIPKTKADDSEKPNGYVTVSFTTDGNGSLEGTTTYFVNPNKEADFTQTAANMTKKPKIGYTVKGGTWAPTDFKKTFKANAEFKFSFVKLENVIPAKENEERPEGYVTVTLIPTDKATDQTKANKSYWVKANTDISISSKPTGKTETLNGIEYTYTFKGWKVTRGTIASWDNETIAGKFIQDTEITAQYTTKVDRGIIVAAPVPKKNAVTPINDKPKPEDLIGNPYDPEHPDNKDNLPDGTNITYVTEPKVDKDGKVTAKVKIEYPGGKTTIIDVPLTVVKNVVPQVGNDKPLVPDTYVKVTVDTTDKATDNTKFEKVFWVKPNVEVTIDEVKNPTGKEETIGDVTKTNKFVKWQRQGATPDKFYETEIKDIFAEKTETTIVAVYEQDKNVEPKPNNNLDVPQGSKPNAKDFINNVYNDNDSKNKDNLPPGTKFEFVPGQEPNTKDLGQDKQTTIKVIYPNGETKTVNVKYNVTNDVAEQEKGKDKPAVPADFVKVTVDTTDKATDQTKFERTFWVNPKKQVTIPVDKPIGKVGENAQGETVQWQFTDWNKSLTGTFKEATTITAQYEPETLVPGSVGYVVTEEGVQPTPDQYKRQLTPPQGREIKQVDVLTPPDVTKPGAQTAKLKVTYDDGTSSVVPMTVFVQRKPQTDWQTGTLGSTRILTVVEKEVVKVPAEKTFRKEVRYMQGFNNYFRPTEGLTRAEAAQILANALVEDGYRYDPNFAIRYKDIVGNEWYAKAIRITSQANVFKGYDTGYFDPHKKITRAEWIGTLRRFQELERAPGNHMQVRPDHWAMGEIEAAYKEGWLAIYGQGLARFNADEFIPRQEVAAVSNKAFNRVLDKTYIHRNSKNLINYKDVNPSMWSYEDILCASNGYLHDGKSFWGHKIDYKKDLYNINLDGYTVTKDKFQRLERR